MENSSFIDGLPVENGDCPVRKLLHDQRDPKVSHVNGENYFGYMWNVQTSLNHFKLVGGFKYICPFHIWDVIRIPLTFTPSFFKMGRASTTNQDHVIQSEIPPTGNPAVTAVAFLLQRTKQQPANLAPVMVPTSGWFPSSRDQCEAPGHDSSVGGHITPMSLWFMDVYGTYNYSYWGESKPTYNWGASHCRDLLF